MLAAPLAPRRPDGPRSDRLTDRGRCLVMGVVNVTPDSFSDGGRYLDPDVAVRHGLALFGDGADLVDVGGESTRPGAGRVPAGEERARVLPVVAGLAAAGVVVSVDTMRAGVASAALQAGAHLVNDVSGGLGDPEMASVVAAAGVPYVVMHWRGHSDRMTARASYRDVVPEVRDALARRVDRLTAAGVDPRQLVLDPGLGFAKEAEHNWALLRGLAVLVDLGLPVLVGASRKRFLRSLLAADQRAGDQRAGDQQAGDRQAGDPVAPDPVALDAATAASSALAASAGAWCVRVHDVRSSAAAVRVAAAWAGPPAAAGPGTAALPEGTR